jgi:hypothetical protein
MAGGHFYQNGMVCSVCGKERTLSEYIAKEMTCQRLSKFLLKKYI